MDCRALAPAAALLALVACNPRSTAGDSPPVATGPLSVDAATTCAASACQRLVAAKVAASCAPITAAASSVVGFGGATFTPIGTFAKDSGSVLCYRSDVEYQKGDAVSLDPVAMGTAPDDFPAQRVASSKTRLTVFWTSDTWDACRKHQSVAACAKTHPHEYAAFKSLYGAAKVTVSGS